MGGEREWVREGGKGGKLEGGGGIHGAGGGECDVMDGYL